MRAAIARKLQEILRQALQRDPNSSPAHFYLALALNQLPTLPEALRASGARHQDRSQRCQRPRTDRQRSDPGRAGPPTVSDMFAMPCGSARAIPVMPVWLEFAGNGELELNNYPEAIAMFQRSIAPRGYPRSWAGLAAAHALAGSPDEAHRIADKLKTFAPTSAMRRWPGSSAVTMDRGSAKVWFSLLPCRRRERCWRNLNATLKQRLRGTGWRS